jgi:hypothetical protein
VQRVKGFARGFVDRQRRRTIGAVAWGGPKGQEGPWREHISAGTLAGHFLLITLKEAQGSPLDTPGVFFRACAWKKRGMLSGARATWGGAWRAVAIASKLRWGCWMDSTRTQRAACVLNAPVRLGGGRRAAGSRCRRLISGWVAR